MAIAFYIDHQVPRAITLLMLILHCANNKEPSFCKNLITALTQRSFKS
jgi:hypothetical protein